MRNPTVTLVSDDSFTALPGELQSLEVDGELVFRADVTAKPQGVQDGNKAIVTLTLPYLEAEGHIQMLEEMFRPADPEEDGSGILRRFKLEGDCLEDAVTDLAFVRFGTAWDRSGTITCKLSFCEHSALGGL